MYIWLIHRITGVGLIVLILTKIISGFQLFDEAKPEGALALHRNFSIDVCLIIAFSLHSAFGLRNIAYEIGWFQERAITAVSVILGAAASVVGIVIYVGWIGP